MSLAHGSRRCNPTSLTLFPAREQAHWRCRLFPNPEGGHFALSSAQAAATKKRRARVTKKRLSFVSTRLFFSSPPLQAHLQHGDKDGAPRARADAHNAQRAAQGRAAQLERRKELFQALDRLGRRDFAHCARLALPASFADGAAQAAGAAEGGRSAENGAAVGQEAQRAAEHWAKCL